MAKQRVVIDFEKNGNFSIYSDPEVEVICREEHMPDEGLYRFGTYAIPEDWLRDKSIGFWGDGSEEDMRAQMLREAYGSARAARARGA
jgi:hypothetical protein